MFALLALVLMQASTPTPPVAGQTPHVRELHGRRLEDPYFWLRERESPKVLAHLTAENAYTDAVMQHTAPLQQQLYAEMLARIQQTDVDVPNRYRGHWYYSRTVEGQPYPIYCRRAGSLEAPEQVLLDVNEMARGKKFLIARPLAYSRDGRLMAYGIDPTGGRVFTIRFRDLTTGSDLPDVVENTAGNLVFAADNATYYYTTDDEAIRPEKLWRSRLGSSAAPELLHAEPDERFYLYVAASQDESLVLLQLESMKTSEWRYVSAAEPTAPLRIVEPRRQGVEYNIAAHGEDFYILHNDGALNFELAVAPQAAPQRANWRTLLAHDPNVYLQGLLALRDHLVISQRGDGLPQLRVRRLADGAEHVIAQPEAAHSVRLGDNLEFETTTLRFEYESPITPPSVFDYDLESRARTLLKERPVLGGYDRARYKVERLDAPASDGALVPLTLVYRADAPPANRPTLLSGYGSYGYSSEAEFGSNEISLLDRGFVLATAHVRGGSERGRVWYESGRMRQKRNSFTDFIACAEHLIAKGYTTPSRLAIRGGSAGGLLMGATINLRPDLFRACIADVPFMDVMNTMLDPDLPLTVIEYEQWGNPNEPGDFEYMLSYSPYDNVATAAYPAVLTMTSLHDSNVSYWEAIKWVARLRERKTGPHVVLARINMDAGHGGASDRYERLREDAFRFAFLIDQLAAAPQPAP